MADPFIGQIIIFGGNFAPRGWAECNGQLLQISQNTALFSLLGTTFGGDGRVTMGLPNMQSRAPMHPGSGPGLTTRRLGEKSGAETATIQAGRLTAHNHQLSGSENEATASNPSGALYAGTEQNTYDSAGNPVPMGETRTTGGQPHNNMQPFLTLLFVIALVGTYPTRD